MTLTKPDAHNLAPWLIRLILRRVIDEYLRKNTLLTCRTRLEPI